MSEDTRTPHEIDADHARSAPPAAPDWSQPDAETDDSLRTLLTLGVMAAFAIAFLAVCLPLFIL